MTDLQHLAPHELLDRIENRNRRFKIASVIFGGVLMLGLVVLLVVGLQTLEGVNRQLESQKKLLTTQQKTLTAIDTSGKKTGIKIDDLQNHVDCIVELLRQPNRSTLTITDLQSCQITKNGVVSPSSNNSVGSTPPQSSGTAPKQNATSGGVSNSPSTPTPTPTPVNRGSTLDRVPVLGRVFKAIGL